MGCEWQTVETDADVEQLLSRFGGFHDGCLREVHIWTGTWVSEDRAMHFPPNLDTHVRVLFQRQWLDPSAVELLFDAVTGFFLSPANLNDIYDAALFISEGTIYWADWCEWRPDCLDRDGCTWIAARKLYWRDASKWMGEQLRYGPGRES